MKVTNESPIILAHNLPRGSALTHGVKLALLTSTVLGGAQSALAQEKKGTVEEVTVTAQKRSENLQSVPVSIQALSTARIEQFNITQFGDYVKFLPSVTFQSGAPGNTNVYMRGVASGGDGNHSGPLPSVGIYLDEMPITTIAGALDVHIYDVARIEALAGPQSTLYGASSQSGTLRIISNRPEIGVTKGGFDLAVTNVENGGIGNIAEGFVNLPISSNMAIRLVGWEEYDSGYIDNKPGKLTFPVSGITINNSKIAKKAYNDVTTVGGRAALRININDNWTITPALIAQFQRSNGVFGFNPKTGDLQVSHFFPEYSKDKFYQAAMTVEGKIGNFDLVYSGGYFQRSLNTASDYTDYSFFYDTLFGSGAYITDAKGNLINPAQRIVGRDSFTKQSNELRISSPASDRFRVTAGLFYERQTRKIGQNYVIDGFDPFYSVKGWPNTIWLTAQLRTDRDYAAFGEASYDITKALTVSGGLRVFNARNSLKGFFGYGRNFSSRTGEAACFAPGAFQGAPCVNLDKVVDETGVTYKGNVSYKFDDDRMVYFTASSGFRPGGINRRGGLPPYLSDTLENYEVGWKTSWADNQVRWNGAVFFEDWTDFQFSFLGPNGLTQIANAGQASIKGVETDVTWAVNAHLTLSGAMSYTDAGLSQPYCGTLDASGRPVINCAKPQAPNGTVLPTIPDFKGNATARYDFSYTTAIEGWVQASAVYTGKRTSDLRVAENANLGNMPAYTTIDFSVGGNMNGKSLEVYVKNLGDERGQTYRYSQCAASVCAANVPGIGQGGATYVVPVTPRLVGLKYSQRF